MNWETDVKFCPNVAGVSALGMADIIGEDLFNSDGSFRRLLLTRYIQMQELFRDVHFNDSRWDLTLGDIQFANVVEVARPKKDARLRVPVQYINSSDGSLSVVQKEANFGHDLPVWFCRNGDEDASSRRVMLVAQDPRRNNDEAGGLYISSPYGLHSADYRAGGNGVLVYNVVDALMAVGAIVYVTDALKLYARRPGYIRENYPSVVSKSDEVLKKEIETFDPDIILFIGKDAAEMALNEEVEEFENNTIPFPLRLERTIMGKKRTCLIAHHTSRLNQCRGRLIQAGLLSETTHSQAAYSRYYVDAILNGGWTL